MSKSEVIQSNIYRILPKVNQKVIYTMDTTCEPNIIILAQTILEIICSQGSIGLRWERGRKTSKKRGIRTTILTDKKKIRVCLFFMLNPHIKFQDPVFNRFWPYASVTDARTYEHVHGQSQTYMPPQLLRSWGHNKTIYKKINTLPYSVTNNSNVKIFAAPERTIKCLLIFVR